MFFLVSSGNLVSPFTAEFLGAHKQCYKSCVTNYNTIYFLKTMHEEIPYTLRNPMV